MNVNILLIGNGAREHILAETLLKSKHTVKLFSFMAVKNPGIAELSANYIVGNLNNNELICEFAKRNNITFAVIGSEGPLANGVVDSLWGIGIPSIGPGKKASQLESSKTFARELLRKYEITGNPEFKSFISLAGINEFITQLIISGDGYVLKADGLAGGKGVKVSGVDFYTKEEALDYCSECINTYGKVVVEEKLVGEEFSLISFSDGITVKDTIPVQDHKRSGVDDVGYQTGGMGSYSSENHLLPFLRKEDVEQASIINKKVIEALYKELGVYYKGVLYGGFILTKKGVKLIEYNVRFGDPEAINILSVLESDLVEIFLGIISQSLVAKEIKFLEKATVCKYVVPKGYPNNPIKGKIEIDEEFAHAYSDKKNSRYYYASIEDKNGELWMTGSRALCFASKEDSIEAAEQNVERAINFVSGEIYHRTDIGTKELLQKKVKYIHELLGIPLHYNSNNYNSNHNILIMKGKEPAEMIKERLRTEIGAMPVKPGLAVVLVGNNPASKVYVNAKEKACKEIGIHSEKIELPELITQEELLNVIKKLNSDSNIHGILVQIPLPKHLDEKEIIETIDFRKDVDGFHPVNAGFLASGDHLFVPCTPKGIMKLLEYYSIDLKGKHAVII